MLSGVSDVGSQGETIINGVKEGAQVVVEQGSIRPSNGKPTRSERDDQEDIESGKDAEDTPDIEVAYGYIPGSLRLLEHHPGNQETA